MACGRDTTAPRLRAPFQASREKPKRAWHAVIECPSS